MNPAGRVIALWRYPIKSFLGERLEQASVGPGGVDGDRRFAVRDRASGHVLSAKKFSMLLTARADSRDGEVVLTLPGGDAMAVDDPRTAATLSEWLGREVDIARPSEGEERPVFEGHLGTFLGQPGGFFDSRAVHLVTTSTLAALTTLHPDGRFDPRRFRPNIVLETGEPGFLEETWLGGTLELGDVLLEITKPCSRCVMTTHAQEDLLVDRDILRTINTHNDEHVGVYGIVRRPGVVRVGDDAVVGS